MSDEEKSKDEVIAETEAAAEHTTEPNITSDHTEPPAETHKKWEMPKPVFQKTSGYLPQGFVKRYEDALKEAKDELPGEDTPAIEEQNEENGNEPNQTPEIVPSPPAPTAQIEPQPDISEQLADEDLNEEPRAPAPKSGAIRSLMILFGLLGIIAFAAIFLALVYYLFFVQNGEINNP